jgi:LemA protein
MIINSILILIFHKSMNPLYIILAVVAIVILWVIMVYNGLIKGKNQVDEAYSDIDVQLKRRYDLIPNLVEAVKGYMTHERETLTKLTEARSRAMAVHDDKGATLAQREQAENALSNSVKGLMVNVEAYPELKANQNFLQLQDELSDTENKIQASRRFYNTNVRDFNTKLEVFPTNMIANMLGFKSREFFEAAEGEKENIKVGF